MKWTHPVRTAVTALAMLSFVSSSEAQRNRAGDFDYYLLSMSLAPSFCSLRAANRSKSECQELTAEQFQQTPLTAHGLWPNRAHVSVNRQPGFCADTPLQLSGAVQTDLARYMPGGPDLEQHEWARHGTCSGLSPEDYFTTIVNVAKQMNDVVGVAMRDTGMLGGQVNVRNLISEVAAKDSALAASIVVDCKQASARSSHRQSFLVDEIRFILSKELEPLPASSVGMGQNSGCPGGVGRIPSVR
jgi:ribonuclease T2